MLKYSCIFLENVVICIKYIFKVRLNISNNKWGARSIKNIAKGGSRHEKKEEKEK